MGGLIYATIFFTSVGGFIGGLWELFTSDPGFWYTLMAVIWGMFVGVICGIVAVVLLILGINCPQLYKNWRANSNEKNITKL